MRGLLLLPILFALTVQPVSAQPSGCPFNLSACQVRPSAASTSTTAATVAAQSGVLLDTFFVTGDADYTAAMGRAVAAGVAVLLGPKTYTINNFQMAGTPATFTLRGVPGKSIIQRSSAVGSQQFRITAVDTHLSGVTWDMNKAVVTANQWGVFFGEGGQNVDIRNCVFKNNGGSLGDGLVLIQTSGVPAGGEFLIEANEMTGNAQAGIFLASVQDGVVSHNYIHDNTGNGIVANSWTTKTSTNHIQNVLISENRIFRNSTGVSLGGYGPPYDFTIPGAIDIRLDRNLFEDNRVYAAGIQGAHMAVTDNIVRQSDPSVIPSFGGMFLQSQKVIVKGNIVTYSGANWGIDAGGSSDAVVTDNVITMTQGNALNAGANTDSLFSNNRLILSGTASGITLFATETDGNFSPMPTLSSNTVVENNVITMSSSSAVGIQLRDNAGGLVGAKANIIRRNDLQTTGGGGGAFQDILFYGAATSVVIDQNFHNGGNFGFVEPNGSGDTIFDNVYLGGIISGVSSTSAVRSLITRDINTYGAGGSILYVFPSAGGSGYTAGTTTLAAAGTGGGSGWTGSALVLNGAIIGVRTNTFGSGYSGTITVAATDTGGGTGATFTVGNLPRFPSFSKLTYVANVTSQFVQKSGGSIGIGVPAGFYLSNVGGNALSLQAGFGGSSWNVLSYNLPTIAIGILPTCGATQSGAQIYVSGSVSGKWQARCDATNWIAPDGTTIN